MLVATKIAEQRMYKVTIFLAERNKKEQKNAPYNLVLPIVGEVDGSLTP